MTTIADVAKAAGVSPMTVSNAMSGKPNVSDKTRERVLETARQLNYHVNIVARGLRSGKTNTIGLAIPELDSPFPSRFAAEVTNAASDCGYRVLVQQTHSLRNSEQSLLSLGNSGLVDGLIFSAIGSSNEEMERASKNFPVVVYDDHISNPSFDMFCSPNREGAAAATKILVENGARNIVVLGTEGPFSNDGFYGQVERWQGALEQVRSYGDIGIQLTPIHCNWTTTAARSAMHSLVDNRTKFDSVFGLTDSVALGALRGLADYKIKCPEEIKVIGFDGIHEGEYSIPSLSTVDINIKGIARNCVALLMEKIGSKSVSTKSTKHVLPFRVIQRESTTSMES